MDTTKLFNLEVEREVLGAIINNNDSICEVIDIIESNDFYNDKNKLIYSVIERLYKQGNLIDLTTISNALGKNLKAIGGITYLSEMISSSITSKSIKQHAQIIKEKSNTRQLIRILNETLKDTEDKKIDEIITGIQDKLLNIKDSTTSDNGNVAEGLERLMENLQQRFENGGQIQGIPTGYTLVDKTINGLNKQDFIIVAARPSMGKTAYANNLTINTAFKAKAKVNFFSLEMSKEQLLERMLAATANIEMEKIKKGALTDKEWTAIAQITSVLSSPNLKIYDKIFSLNGIKAECKKTKLQGGLDVVIIDYLQLIQNGKGQDRQNEVSEISRQLKLMAKELDCTVISLAQLSRAPEQRADHRPILSDLRESGSIEQDADIVMFLYRDEYYNPETESKNVIENIVAKNRNGEVGTLKLTWLPKYQKVVNYSAMQEVNIPNPFKR